MAPAIDQQRPGGLTYLPEFFSRDDQMEWLHRINGFAEECWISDFKRRILCFGYVYDFSQRTVAQRLGPLPPFLRELGGSVVTAGLMNEVADQVIINEYLPGQGISAHVDAPCFGPEIVSLSLGSGSVMRLRERQTGAIQDIHLDQGSALKLSGPARWQWAHEIIGRKKDLVNGIWVPRSTRLSITLRKVRSSFVAEGV